MQQHGGGFFLAVFKLFFVFLFFLHQQDVIRNTVEDRIKMEMERKQREEKAAVFASRKSALDRFKK